MQQPEEMNTDFGLIPTLWHAHQADRTDFGSSFLLSGCAHLSQIVLFQQLFTKHGPHARSWPGVGSQHSDPHEPDVPSGEVSSPASRVGMKTHSSNKCLFSIYHTPGIAFR